MPPPLPLSSFNEMIWPRSLQCTALHSTQDHFPASLPPSLPLALYDGGGGKAADFWRQLGCSGLSVGGTRQCLSVRPSLGGGDGRERERERWRGKKKVILDSNKKDDEDNFDDRLRTIR